GRPFLFARKPAPVQAAWLAYPGTTGLRRMDYRLSDPYLEPRDLNPGYYFERSMPLPQTYWCYDPQISEPPVNPLPADSNGFVTFGCLNNLCKMNDEVLRTWAPIFAALPNSRLLIYVPAGSARRRVLDGLKIEPERVDFVERQLYGDYRATFHRIDICLD